MKILKDKKDVFIPIVIFLFSSISTLIYLLNLIFDVIKQGEKKYICVKEDYFLIR